MTCLDTYSLEDIEIHADECSMYLLNEHDEVIYNVINIDCEEVEPSITAITDLTKSELKQNLIHEITHLANTHLVNETPRRTVRQKSIWEHLKNELCNNKITAIIHIKVVFARELAVDNGDPGRELFSSKGFAVLFYSFSWCNQFMHIQLQSLCFCSLLMR